MWVQAVIWQILWGLASVVLAELVRDCYHLLGHYWQPLIKLHNWHHRVYKKDFTAVSPGLYRQAQLYNDLPESLAMLGIITILAVLMGGWGLWLGVAYSGGFLITAIARSQGWLMATDLTHEPGELTTLPSNWWVNRTYHWRHHFDDPNAYFAGSFTLADKVIGTAVSLKGKTVAVTGASGSLGRALIQELLQQRAKPIALTTSREADFPKGVATYCWQPGLESELEDLLHRVDILVINHGINVHGERTPAAIETSLQVNALSGWRLMEIFFATVHTSSHRAIKEVWVNTSEAEVNPAFSPLYEVSKRLMGDLVTLRRLDATCVVRKLVLGPFKSGLNPIGVMSAETVAWAIVALAKRNVRNIIVTINPLTYVFFPLKELSHWLYFKLFSQPC
ncbi:MAG: bifunctional sterol desaturase/short chain dehydrogenase [Cyanobacteria bacterium REEB459]|nr:bifunctional sterol desaturase/short chain dehydrogenase [Cyanobacteria bacterium REEB459]